MAGVTGLMAGLATGAFSGLNLISLLGLGVLLLLAWAMGSERSRVNWRLVGSGLMLQLAIAALLFNSQSWTFPLVRPEINTLAELNESIEKHPEWLPEVERYVADLRSSHSIGDPSVNRWLATLRRWRRRMV